MAYGLWPMAYGLWPMAYGLWPMAYGLWPYRKGLVMLDLSKIEFVESGVNGFYLLIQERKIVRQVIISLFDKGLNFGITSNSYGGKYMVTLRISTEMSRIEVLELINSL